MASEYLSQDVSSSTLLTLQETFDAGLQLHQELEDAEEPPASMSYQERLRRAIAHLEDATFMVNQLSLFSRNENLEDIPTSHLKYLLLPALLASLTLKLTKPRHQALLTAETYFRDFVWRCRYYEISNERLPKPRPEDEDDDERQADQSRSLEAAVSSRNAKLYRYNQQKKMEKRIGELKVLMENSDEDDESSREYYLTIIKKWVLKAIEEVGSIEMEKPLAERMMAMEKDRPRHQRPDASRLQPKRPLKPFVLTRSEVQKRVYGLGYPGIPTMTVEEFMMQRYPDEDIKPALEGLSLQSMVQDPERAARELEREREETELKEETEDAVHLIRERAWDDWKDDHRTGWGNRKNMG